MFILTLQAATVCCVAGWYWQVCGQKPAQQGRHTSQHECRVKIYFRKCAIGPHATVDLCRLHHPTLLLPHLTHPVSCVSDHSRRMFPSPPSSSSYRPYTPFTTYPPTFSLLPLCFCRSHLPACWASEGHINVRVGGRGWRSHTHLLLWVADRWIDDKSWECGKRERENMNVTCDLVCIWMRRIVWVCMAAAHITVCLDDCTNAVAIWFDFWSTSIGTTMFLEYIGTDSVVLFLF